MKVNFLTNNQTEYAQNFNGRTAILKKANAFAGEIIKQAAGGKMSIKKIRTTIHDFMPGVDVISIPTNKKNCQDIGGYFRAIMNINPQNPPALNTGKRIIYLRKPPAGRENFLKYISSVVHEMTHAFQSADDKFAEDLFITKNLRHLPYTDWKSQISLGYRTFLEIESDLFKPAIFAHRGLNKTNTQNGIYSIILDPQKLQQAIITKLNKIKKENPKADIPFMKKLIGFIAKSEIDAYRMDECTKAALSGTKLTKENHFIPNLYRNFANAVSEGGV